MTTKLNLTLNESTVRRIKIYAEKNNVSVSRLAEEYFDRITRPKSKINQKQKFSQRAGGIINDLVIKDISAKKDEYLGEKYGIQNFF